MFVMFLSRCPVKKCLQKAAIYLTHRGLFGILSDTNRTITLKVKCKDLIKASQVAILYTLCCVWVSPRVYFL